MLCVRPVRLSQRIIPGSEFQQIDRIEGVLDALFGEPQQYADGPIPVRLLPLSQKRTADNGPMERVSGLVPVVA